MADTNDNPNQTTALPNGALSNDNASNTATKREVSNDLQPGVVLVALEPAGAEPAAPTKRHNHVFDCSSASTPVQMEYKESRYHCDSVGKVQAQYGRCILCDTECECCTLATCLVTQQDVVCLEDELGVNAKDELSEIFTAQVMNETSVLLYNGTVLTNVRWE